jgi:hypothetical protein
LFQSVDLDQPDAESPVWVNWDFLEAALGLSREDVTALMHRARELGLMARLTIDYDHERWLRHSRVKGCLVVMTCVEETDLHRDQADIATAYCDEIDRIVQQPPPRGILGNGDELGAVFVVPNGHLDARAGPGLPWQDALAVLQCLPIALRSRGYSASLNSYGYEKLIKLAINAHKVGYTLRVV